MKSSLTAFVLSVIPPGIWQVSEEFGLACQFLHDAGVIVQHCSSRQHQSSVFFLSPQWLSDTLFVILRTQFREVGKGGEVMFFQIDSNDS